MPNDHHSYLRFRAHEEARHVEVVHGHVLKDPAATAHVLHRRRRRVPGRKLNLEGGRKRRRLDSHMDTCPQAVPWRITTVNSLCLIATPPLQPPPYSI